MEEKNKGGSTPKKAEEEVKVGSIVDGMCVIAICDNLLMCEGITPFDRSEE